MIKESTITTKLIKELRKAAGIWVKKRHQNRFSTGEPDVFGLLEGRPFFLEVKRLEDGELSKLQAATMTQITAAGGYAALYCWDSKKKRFLVLDTRKRCFGWPDGKVRKLLGGRWAALVSLDCCDILNRVHLFYAGKL